ncbi:MAG: hypothetical protein JW795_11905 [Chitinivibrionales bacterium]|nr:hypothetical protein [Chitinivibrionales bacterium]
MAIVTAMVFITSGKDNLLKMNGQQAHSQEIEDDYQKYETERQVRRRVIESWLIQHGEQKIAHPIKELSNE